MTFRVVFADRAAEELEAAARWWRENRSSEQADRWYSGIVAAISSLQIEPERHPLARENGRFTVELRQLNYGQGRRLTHRAVFTIQSADVIILAIRHLAQQDLAQDELH